jgi:hypothetical protein
MNPNNNPVPLLTRLKRIPPFGVLLMLLFQTSRAFSDKIERISREDLKPLKDGMPGEQGMKRAVMLATDVKMTASIESRPKAMAICTLEI